MNLIKATGLDRKSGVAQWRDLRWVAQVSLLRPGCFRPNGESALRKSSTSALRRHEGQETQSTNPR
jgi:hypothetical protein